MKAKRILNMIADVIICTFGTYSTVCGLMITAQSGEVIDFLPYFGISLVCFGYVKLERIYAWLKTKPIQKE